MTAPEGTVHRPPFPIGWFAVAALDEVPVGALMPLAAFGRDLAVGIAPGGRALVTDSVCPHLGADLAAGGLIDDGQVVCPLHEWCFSHAGACVSSGSEPMPADISLRVWPTEVVGGTVLAFNGRDGEVPAAGPPDLASGGGGEDRVGGRDGHPEDVVVDLLLAAGVTDGTADGDRWSARAGDGATVVVHGPGTVEHRRSNGTTDVVYVTPVDGFAVLVRSAGPLPGIATASDRPASAATGDLPGFRSWYRRFDASSAPRPRPVRSGRRNRRDAPAG